MGTIILKEAVKIKKTITVEKKPALKAKVCDNCGKVFIMKEFCNEGDVGVLRGTFSDCRFGDGNGFKADVCSFACADIITNGGWVKMKEYHQYKKIGAILGRCSVTITPYIQEKEELIENWGRE